MAKKKATKRGAVTRKATTTVVTEAPVDESEDDFSEIEDPFERVRLEFGDSIAGGHVSMSILQVPPNGDPAYLMQVDYNEDTHGPDWIREQFGPGKYVLRFLDRGSSQMWSKRFTVARLPGERDNNEGGELLSVMREQNKEMMGFVLSNRQGGGKAGDTSQPFVAMMEQQSQLNQVLLAALLNKPDPTALFIQSAEKIFEAVSNMKGESSGDFVSQLPKLFKELRPLLDNLKTPAAPAAAVPGVVATAPNPALTSGAPAPLGPPQPLQGFVRTGVGNSPATPIASTSDIQPAARPGELVGNIDQLFGYYAPQFQEAAEAGQHPGVIANVVLDSVPAVFHDDIGKMTVDRLLEMHPTLSSHTSWLGEMVGHVEAGGYEPDVETPPPAS